jgi:hypothetical protein
MEGGTERHERVQSHEAVQVKDAGAEDMDVGWHRYGLSSLVV